MREGWFSIRSSAAAPRRLSARSSDADSWAWSKTPSIVVGRKRGSAWPISIRPSKVTRTASFGSGNSGADQKAEATKAAAFASIAPVTPDIASVAPNYGLAKASPVKVPRPRRRPRHPQAGARRDEHEPFLTIDSPKLLDFVSTQHGINDKAKLAALIVEKFCLTQDRSVYYCADFAIRFSSGAGSSFSNTVLSLKLEEGG